MLLSEEKIRGGRKGDRKLISSTNIITRTGGHESGAECNHAQMGLDDEKWQNQ
jgi:hypothetical protein